MKRLVLVTLGLLATLLAAAVIWREAAVERLASAAIAAQGLGPARLEVTRVTARSLVIEDAVLADGAVDLPRVEIGYTPAGLFAGRIDEVVLRGPRLDAGRLGGLPLPAPGGGEGGAALGRLVIEAGRIDPGTVPAATVAIDAVIDFAAETAEADVDIESGGSRASLALHSRGLAADAAVAVTGKGDLRLADLPGLSALPGTGPDGRIGFDLAGEGRFPDPGAIPAWLPAGLDISGTVALAGLNLPQGPQEVSAAVGWRLTGDGAGLALALTEPATVTGRMPAAALAPLVTAGGETVDLSLAVAGDGPILAWRPDGAGGRADLSGRVGLALDGAAAATADIDVALRHGEAFGMTGLAAFGLAVTAEPFAIAAQDIGAQVAALSGRFGGSLSPDGALALAGPVDLQAEDIAGPGFAADTLALAPVLDIAAGPAGWSLRLEEPAPARIGAARLPGVLDLDGPVALALDRLEVGDAGAGLRVAAEAGVAKVAGRLTGPDPPRAFREAGGRVTLDLAGTDPVRGSLALSGGRLLWPAERLRIDAADLVLPLGTGPDAGPVSLSVSLADADRPARHAPLRLAAEGTRTGDALALAGSLSAIGPGVSVPIAAQARLDDISLDLDIGPATIAFAPDGRQPGDLAAILGGLEDVAGAVNLAATARLGGDAPPRIAASLGFQDVSAAQGDLAVTGLSGSLRMADLLAPASDGRQRLTARAAIVGVPVAAPEAEFSIATRAGAPVVTLHRGSGRVAGGTVTLDETPWDFGAETNELRVRVRQVEIGQLLRDWQVEGVSGTGRLSGAIPVRLAANGLSIRRARLASDGPGAIRVDWGEARERLMRSGEQVALAATALEDFRYEAMAIDIDKPAGGELSFAIGLDGANPAVLNGYPMRFNVTLQGRLEPILAAVREGRRLGGEMFWGGLGGTPPR